VFLKRKQLMACREIYFFANMVSGHCAKNTSNPDKALLQKDHSNIESMSLTSKRWLPEKCARRKKRGVNQVNAILEND